MSERRVVDGKLFQSRGPATVKLRCSEAAYYQSINHLLFAIMKSYIQ